MPQSEGMAAMTMPSARSVRHALDVLARLPIEAQADLAECIIDRLDLVEGDCDREAEEDYCEAEDRPAILAGGTQGPFTRP